MNHWADFVITAVRYDANHHRIIGLLVRRDEGDHLSTGSEWSREQVVAMIEAGYSFVTAKSRDGQWYRGANVHVVEVDGEKFIRTDRNAQRADNLGALPELNSTMVHSIRSY